MMNLWSGVIQLIVKETERLSEVGITAVAIATIRKGHNLRSGTRTTLREES